MKGITSKKDDINRESASNISIFKSKYLPVTLAVLVGAFVWKLTAERSYFVPLLLFLSMGALVIYCFSRYNSSLLAIFLIAFSLRFASSFIFSNFFWYDDEKTYHHFGILISERLSAGQGLAGEGFYISDIYYSLNGILYHLFGENTLVGRALNILVGSLIPFILYDIARKIYKDGYFTDICGHEIQRRFYRFMETISINQEKSI